MMGSATLDDILYPRYRQVRPFVRPGHLLRADDWGGPGRRLDTARPRPPPENPAVLCRQIYEGGKRLRVDIVEFITIAGTLDVDALKLMTLLLSGSKGKSARAKPGPKRDTCRQLRCKSDLSNDRHECRRV